MRTLGIWIFGLLAAGLAGSIIALALIRPPAGDGQFLTFFGGFLSGTFAFACARLWFAAPSKNSN